MVKTQSGISTLERVCSILNSFSEDRPILTLTEISRQVNLPKSTTHRLIEALKNQGMIIADFYGRGYQLGYQMVRWGTLAQVSMDLRNTSLPIMHSLVNQTDETVILSVLYQNMGIWIEKVECQQPIRLALRMGKPLVLYAGASSKILWAFLPQNEINEILSQIKFEKFLPNTIADSETMRNELEDIRQRGYATSFEETDPGAMGVAAPIYNHKGKVIAGIGIVAPHNRVPAERVPEIARYVVAAGDAISRRMGLANQGI